MGPFDRRSQTPVSGAAHCRSDRHDNAADHPFRLHGEGSVFHVLRETECPYLPERSERKLLTELLDSDSASRYDALSRAGFRRSHSFAYRPACAGCQACKPVRVPVSRFVPSRSQRRTMRLNLDLVAHERPPQATLEQFAIFKAYLETRHGSGEMAEMEFDDYRSMVEQTKVQTRLIEFRDASGSLTAILLLDWLESGASAVYSFFDPATERRSLGTYMVLWLIEATRARGLSHVYLGYLIAETAKMAYKVRFRPLEQLGAEGWGPLQSKIAEL